MTRLFGIISIGMILLATDIFCQAPYPPSKLIQSIAWADTSKIIRLAEGCDNFPLTWAGDGNLYTTWGDGTGFNSPHRRSMGFAMISGFPPDISPRDIRSDDEQFGDGRKGKKGWGLLCVDNIIYLWMGHADNNGGQAQLAWSDNYMKKWKFADWHFSEFGLMGFVNFGKNYDGARDNYVYAYSHDGSLADTPADRFVLLRVPQKLIAEKDAYEFFVKLDHAGMPVWSGDIEQRGAVFKNPDGCLRSAMSYNAGLKRYLWWQQVPAPKGSKDRGDTRFEGGFGIYESPNPWGPWSTVYYTEKWDTGPGEHGDFPAKWISPDGLTMHLVFSGNDSFSIRKLLLNLR